MRITYQQKLIFSFLAIFVLFAGGIVLFEQSRSRHYKTEALEEKLDAYADVIGAYLSVNDWQMNGPHSPLSILPPNLRVTIIRPDGTVDFDNLFPDISELGNHLQRPEVEEARRSGKGHDIRTSESNSQPYLYYAKHSKNGFIRVALPYDIQVKSFLKPNNAFLYFSIGLLIVGIIFIHYVGNYFGRSIRKLRDFSKAVARGDNGVVAPEFPKDELGEIGRQIVSDYRKLEQNEAQLSLEREKLLQHIHSSAEGVCFFNPDGTVAFYNELFRQYLYIINRDCDLNKILSDGAFKPIKEFLRSGTNETYHEYVIKEGYAQFLVRFNRFEDEVFEIVLNDISEQEKTRMVKREMTGNIAHELRTPVTSIRGFLETMLHTSLTPEQRHQFTEKAYNQTLTLSELIRDMGLLTKMESTPDQFDFKSIDLHGLLQKIAEELTEDFSLNQITFHNELSSDLKVFGNESLLYSIFRNLADNVVKHAGKRVKIIVGEINRKDGYIQISFADTGKGVANEDLLYRIFERFYRIDEGRTRDSGGSGLGLSIVKNAVLIHRGSIVARKHKKGGLEFIIRLPL